MAEPLTKEERDEIVLALVALKQRWGHNTWVEHTALRYEATVKDRENRIAALEAEYARLREKAGEWLEYRRDALETGSEDIAEAYMMADDALVAAIDAALKEGNADG